MMVTMPLVLVAIGFASGLLIGTIGIGGVILVPILTFLVGFPITDAITAAMIGYIAAGIIGITAYARKASIRWDLAAWLCASAAPAAVAGAWASNRAPATALEIVIGLFTVASGVNAMLSRSVAESSKQEIAKGMLTTVGAITGFGSAISGTGGPLLLVPMLLWLRQPVLMAIGLSQAIQLTIAITATAGNFAFGTPDLTLGLQLAVGLALGTWVGAKVAHAVPREVLRTFVSLALVVIGIAICAKVAQRIFLAQ